jgi:hypothetical protein
MWNLSILKSKYYCKQSSDLAILAGIEKKQLWLLICYFSFTLLIELYICFVFDKPHLISIAF